MTEGFIKSIAAASLLALGLAGVAATAAGAQTLQVGAYPANPPWEFKNTDGTFEGFEVDLVNEIAERMGVEVEIQDLGFQALFAATSSGRIDMAISSITITDERLQNQAFTQGYYDSDLALVTGPDSDVTGMADMEGKVVGAISSSTGEAWIKENMEAQGFSEYRGYNAQQDLILDTQNGRVDGGVGDIAGFQFAFVNMPGMNVVERIPSGDRFAIMLPKDSDYLEQVNDAITAIKEDGTMAELHEKWLGVAPDEGTSTTTVMDIPATE